MEVPMSLRAPLLTRVLAPALLGAAGLLSRVSPAQAEDLHEIIAIPAQGHVGSKGRTTVSLAGKNGWHLNEQAPVTLKLTPGPGISVDKQKLGRKDLVEDTKERARFEIPFLAQQQGRRTIEAEASFVICQEAACKPVKEKVTLAVVVGPAPGK
jgi:hypothetical protein